MISSTTLALGGLLITALYSFYRWLLPKPLPGIPYNSGVQNSIFGDIPNVMKEVGASNEFMAWCVKQIEKQRSSMSQIFIMPFGKPWVLMADFGESKDILLRRKEFTRAQFATNALTPMGHFHAGLPKGPGLDTTRQWKSDLTTPNFLSGFVSPITYSSMTDLVELFNTKARVANGRPFDALPDLFSTSEEIFVAFNFGKDLDIHSLRPQTKYLSQVEPFPSNSQNQDQLVTFLDAPVHELFTNVRFMIDLVGETVKIPFAKPYWWLRRMTSATVRHHVKLRNEILLDQIDISIRKLEAGDKKTTAVDMMIAREKIAAEKEGREPQYKCQAMVDEVRTCNMNLKIWLTTTRYLVILQRVRFDVPLSKTTNAPFLHVSP